MAHDIDNSYPSGVFIREDAELASDVADVGFDGACVKREVFADFTIGCPAKQQFKNCFLAGREVETTHYASLASF